MSKASGNNRGHAQYAPSAAHRWMNCHASVKACLGLPSTSSHYAAEGTVAHHVLEQSLRQNVDAIHFVGDEIEVEVEGKMTTIMVDKPMCEAVQVALDWLKPWISEADEWHPEQQVSLALFGAASCYGTSDFTAVVAVAGRLLVVDYKHGQGVGVEVLDNPQLKIYGLGSLLALPPRTHITHVQTTIIQPRFHHPQGPIRTHTYTTAELMDFGADVLYAIEQCESENPAFVPGEWCKWCGIENSCAARAKASIGVLAVIDEMADGMVLSISEQERLLQAFDQVGIVSFVDSLRAALHKYAADGGTLSHYKLVPKRASRVYTKPEAQVAAELHRYVKSGDGLELWKSELKSPAEIEKVIGKGKLAREALAALTTSVSSGTNLVAIGDARPAAAISAEDEFDSLTD
ncbi:MAG TPA: DUF2800 domain-containing protein [Gemmatimonadaceae bacterium]|nr:DUF2800 domain-containing protein [Gemmatimonadaceae bacterium]